MNTSHQIQNEKVGSTQSKERLRTFDFLRGLAILSVIAFHASLSFPSKIIFIDTTFSFGAKGVQLFYFISALTMCYMWKQREGEKNPIKNFYIRRFFRIAPLFWLAIPIYLFVYGFKASYWAPEGLGIKQILLTATFLHGFWPDSINSVVPGGWSIAVEMTFYALFPLLITRIKDNKNIYLYAAAVVWAFNILFFRDFLLVFLSTHYTTVSTTIQQDYLYMNFINQAPIFLLGCYMFFALQSKVKLNEIVFIVAWTAFALALKVLYKFDGSLFAVVYTMLGIFVFTCIKLNVRFKPFELLGKKSYSIYLTHFLVIHFLQKILPIKNGPLALLLGIIFTTLISYLLSIITYVLIEKKIETFVKHITQSKPSQYSEQDIKSVKIYNNI